MTFLPENLYHSGFIVTSLEETVESLQRSGLRRWTAPKEITGVTARFEDRSVAVRFRYAYSCDGPHHLELIEPLDGELFVPDGAISFHHFGFWSEDLERDVVAAAERGMPMEVEFVDDATAARKVTYHRDALGMRYELVPASSRATWDERWAAIP